MSRCDPWGPHSHGEKPLLPRAGRGERGSGGSLPPSLRGLCCGLPVASPAGLAWRCSVVLLPLCRRKRTVPTVGVARESRGGGAGNLRALSSPGRPGCPRGCRRTRGPQPVGAPVQQRPGAGAFLSPGRGWQDRVSQVWVSWGRGQRSEAGDWEGAVSVASGPLGWDSEERPGGWGPAEPGWALLGLQVQDEDGRCGQRAPRRALRWGGWGWRTVGEPWVARLRPGAGDGGWSRGL